MPTQLDRIDPAWLSWFTGFFDGEGCFAASIMNRRYVRAGLVVAQTDPTVINEIAAKFQCGKVQDIKRGYQWRVYVVDDLYRLFIPLFERYPLHTRKAKEYPVWRRLVECCYHHRLSESATRIEAEGNLLAEMRAIRHG